MKIDRKDLEIIARRYAGDDWRDEVPPARRLKAKLAAERILREVEINPTASYALVPAN
jgi:hypothetical protein